MCGGALLGGCVTRQLPYLWLQEVAQRGDQQTVEDARHVLLERSGYYQRLSARAAMLVNRPRHSWCG